VISPSLAASLFFSYVNVFQIAIFRFPVSERSLPQEYTMLRFFYYYILYGYRTILQNLADPKFRSWLIGVELALIFAIQTIETAIYLACYITKGVLFIAAVLSLSQIVLELLAIRMQSSEREGELEVLIGVEVGLDETENLSQGSEEQDVRSWKGSEDENIGRPGEVRVVGSWIELD